MPFLLFWEDNFDCHFYVHFYLHGLHEQVLDFILYFVRFLEFSAYQFLGKYIRKYRCIITDVKNGICPIWIAYWSRFRTFKQNCENSNIIKLAWLDPLQLSLLCFFCFSNPPFFIAWHLLRLHFGGKPFWENFYSDCTIVRNKVRVGSRTRF